MKLCKLFENEDDNNRAIQLINDGKIILQFFVNESTKIYHLSILTDIPSNITEAQLIRLMEFATSDFDLVEIGVHRLSRARNSTQSPKYKQMVLRVLSGQVDTDYLIQIKFPTFHSGHKMH